MDNLSIYIAIALAALELVLRLAPTEKDRSLVNAIIGLIEAIPNIGKKGDRFKTKTVTRKKLYSNAETGDIL
jgi:hypothetical protein